MGVTGGGLVFSVCLCFIVTACAASVIKLQSEEQRNNHWAKREVGKMECKNSKLVVNPTKEATHMKIVTDSGDTVFDVDSTNTNMHDIDNLLTQTTMLFFPDVGRMLYGNSSDYTIIKRPSENGVKVTIVDKFNISTFEKELKVPNEEQKDFGTTCVHLTGFKVVVDPSMDVNQSDGYNLTALVWASMMGERELAKSLVEKGADVNAPGSFGSMALIGAISTGDEELIEYLIKHGAKVKDPVMSPHGPTPLHIAAHKGRISCARILLKHGANVSAQDREGSTPLLYAATERQLDMVKELVARGADVKAATKQGFTALHMAVILGDEDLMHYLLQSGADVNSKRIDGVTPLILAVSHHDKEDTALMIVKHLIHHHKPDVNAKDNKGNTALSLASSKGFSKVEDYLKAHGAV